MRIAICDDEISVQQILEEKKKQEKAIYQSEDGSVTLELSQEA